MKHKDISKKNVDEALSEDELLLLSAEHETIDAIDVNSKQMRSLRSRVMAQVDKQPILDTNDLITIRSDDDNWKQISDKVRKKILYIDDEKGVASYLLRIEPGAEDEPHQHTSDEHCLVLEGDISFGDIHLTVGDYHLAQKGSCHERAYSEHGALLYIQTGIEQQISL